jgi:hypothetical protein
LQVQVDRVPRLVDGIFDRPPGRGAAEDVWDRHSEKVRVLGFLNLDAEAQAARPNGGLTT